MRTENPRRPILYKGETYSKPVQKRSGGGGKEPGVSFQDAKTKMIADLDKVKVEMRSTASTYKTPNEMILCFRLLPEFSAKSYYPATLFENDANINGIQEIGSRLWRTTESDASSENDKTSVGKMFFVRATENSLDRFKEKLNQNEHLLNKNFQLDVRKIKEINILTSSEQVLGFGDNWSEGRIEAVIHPFEQDSEAALNNFVQILENSKVDLNTMKARQYDGGITFISFFGNKQAVNNLAGYNPLRTMHPLASREFPDTRSTLVAGLPLEPTFTSKPTIKVGIIDGGLAAGNKYLDNYVEIEDSVPGAAHPKGLEHGAQVTAAALYGAINNYANTHQLPEPPVSAKVFRVLSVTSGADPDLYEAIDAIEKIVPNNPDISVYNLSLGPKGPILDDHISRFTFACDLLSKTHEVLFCVAVGNDGEMTGYDRIQAPSDMVNGLAIGAYTFDNGEKKRAPYSCKGPGREGSKLKPDIMAFGGCERNPIHLISSQDTQRSYTAGTSFSSPIASAAAAQLVGGSNKAISTLVARALMVHSTPEKKLRSHCTEMGHGTLPDKIEDIIVCPEKSYTLIYEGEIDPKTYVQYEIPWSNDIQEGTVSFRWTMAVLTNVDPHSPDDYTTNSIETTFYPNSKKFVFKRGGQTKRLDVEDDATEIAQLIADGWEQSEFPLSESGPVPYETENDLRAQLKWDSIDCREKSKKANGVKSPMFHVHTMNRGKRNSTGKVKFALVLTIEAPKANVDLYSRVITNFPNLLPLRVDIKTTVPVTI